MYISLNWINDFVDLSGIAPEDIIKKFNLTTAEIEGFEHKGSDLQGVIFAKIEKVENHPNSDHLHILAVNTGTEVLQVVCGAPNVKKDMIVCLAPVGSKVGGHKMTKARLAGVDSYGMCCSESELGIGSNNDGIMEINFPVTLGADIKTVFPIDDVVFEVDNKSLTNRPDLWGHYGMARELSAMFKRPLKALAVDDLNNYSNLAPLSVVVKSPDCLRYSSIAINNITKQISNQQMKIRLLYCGMRDINLLTDLANYLMLELGQPMHTFDKNIVSGIVVKQAQKGTKLLTLEGDEHDIPEDATIICDSNNKPIAIAGIKGGKLSGISSKTNSLLLESACFDSKAIRVTSTKIGLKTDASQRYEKSLDPEMTTQAIARFIYLLKEQDGDVVVSSALTDVYNKHYPSITIETTAEFISSRIGVDISAGTIKTILTRLGFEVELHGGKILVNVPSFRATKDISMQEDLVEEIARSYGYDNIEPKSIKMDVKSVEQNVQHNNAYQTKYILAEKYGMNEVHSHIWNFNEFNKRVGIQQTSYVSLVDDSNAGQAGIRSELAPTLLKFMEENKNSFSDIRMFEIGSCVTGLNEQKLANEELHLAVCLASQSATNEELYYKLKEVLLDITNNIYGKSVGIGKIDNIPNYLHPVNSTNIYSGEQIIGHFGLLHPSVKQAIDKRFNVALLEVNLQKIDLAPQNKFKLKKVSKYQDVNIDYSFMVPKGIKYATIDKHLSQFKTKLVWSYKLIDIYQAPNSPDIASWTFNFNICALDKTLSAKDIDIFNMRLLQHMEQIGLSLKK